MNNYNDENLLEMVEMYAEEMGFISNEDELSEQFDAMVEDMEGIDTDDKPMMDEFFNNWSDGLCKDGEIHPIQYSEYTNTGVYGS